jgi:hypothetical protein
MQEREGYGGNLRHQVDFLEFASEDNHYMLISLTMIMVFALVLAFEWEKVATGSIWLPLMVVRFLQDFFMINVVYFMKEGPRRDWFLSKCIVITYGTLSLGITVL